MSAGVLTRHLAKAVDTWMEQHPDVTVVQVLAALEELRHELTEALVHTE